MMPPDVRPWWDRAKEALRRVGHVSAEEAEEHARAILRIQREREELEREAREARLRTRITQEQVRVLARRVL